MQTALFLCLPRGRLIRERHLVNPARLAELNHQRALVREQLAWLEREIAKESAGFVPPNVVQPTATIVAPVAVQSRQGLPSQQPSPVAAEAEAYRPDPVSTASDTRRGCFVALAVITLVIVGALTAIYIWRYSDRPLLFVGEKDAAASETSASPSTLPSKR